MYNEAMLWVNDNPWIYLILVMMLAIIWRPIMGLFKRKKKPKKEERPLMYGYDEPMPSVEETLFNLEEKTLFKKMEDKDILASLEEQKKLAEDSIRNIKGQGKQILQDEKKYLDEYIARKAKTANDKRQLSFKYDTWISQLKLIDRMIAEHMKIRAEFDKLKTAREGGSQQD